MTGHSPPHHAGRPVVRSVVGPAAHPLTVRGLIQDRAGRWLIVHPIGDEDWHLPGGLVEQDEPPRQACRREIREELGLDLPPGVLLVVGWDPPNHTGRQARVSLVFDLGAHNAQALADRIRLQREELADWRWATPREALRVLHPAIAARLAELELRSGPPTPTPTHTPNGAPTAVYVERWPPPPFTEQPATTQPTQQPAIK